MMHFVMTKPQNCFIIQAFVYISYTVVTCSEDSQELSFQIHYLKQINSRDAGYWIIAHISFCPVAVANTNMHAYFVPPNCRKHQVSPIVELVYYYAYS